MTDDEWQRAVDEDEKWQRDLKASRRWYDLPIAIGFVLLLLAVCFINWAGYKLRKSGV